MRNDPVAAARGLLARRFPSAAIAFLAGSVLRGEHTATSDLDIVVVFDQLSNAYRESLVWDEWPVELFVHDPETLQYFCEQDCWRDGVPSLPAMVSEGIALPNPSGLSKELKAYADKLIAAGPKPWGEREIDDSRYAITDLVEDMKAPRSLDELHACATRLYSLVADTIYAAGSFGRLAASPSRGNSTVFRRLLDHVSGVVSGGVRKGGNGPRLCVVRGGAGAERWLAVRRLCDSGTTRLAKQEVECRTRPKASVIGLTARRVELSIDSQDTHPAKERSR